MNGRRNRSNPKRTLSKPFFTLAALSFAAIAGLGFFRFGAAQLEDRLGGIERSIERYSAEEVELEQSLSSLTSTINIYNYCKDRLGMYAAKQEVVHLPRTFAADAAVSEPQKGWRASMLDFFGLTVN